MEPVIDHTSFGSIIISGKTYDHDVVIDLVGEVKKRKKKLSKKIYGTSHKVSLEEAKYIMKEGAEVVIIGNGQYGALELSDEAKDYFNKKTCRVKLLPTPDAVKAWNTETGNAVAMFHITC
jgi:hypothetical protein